MILGPVRTRWTKMDQSGPRVDQNNQSKLPLAMNCGLVRNKQEGFAQAEPFSQNMPKSKQRGKSSSGRPKKRGPSPPLEDINGVICIKRNVFAKLRSNEDFADMVRVGRLLNVLAHMTDAVDKAPTIDSKNPLTLRRFTRDMFNIAGYVYEGFELISTLYPKHFKEDYFAKFESLHSDPEKPQKRRLMSLMRNAGAFHLDSDNKSTKKALSKLNLNKIDFVSGGDGTFGALYFHLADTLDINYVIDEVKQSEEDERDVYLRMGKLSADLLVEFMYGADDFVGGVARKLDLI